MLQIQYTITVATYIICKTLMMQDSLSFVTFYDLDLMDLKSLGRFRQKAIKQRTRLKIQLTTYVNEVFPKLHYFYKSDLHQISVYAIQKEVPTSEAIASMPYDASGTSSHWNLPSTRGLYTNR